MMKKKNSRKLPLVLLVSFLALALVLGIISLFASSFLSAETALLLIFFFLVLICSFTMLYHA